MFVSLYVLTFMQFSFHFQNCLLLACDWQLSTRTSYWQATNGGQVSSNYLHAFERDLNSLRRITDCLLWARPRVYLHEATLRMMADAAPNATRQLLDKSLIQKSSSRGLFCGGKGTQGTQLYKNR